MAAIKAPDMAAKVLGTVAEMPLTLAEVKIAAAVTAAAGGGTGKHNGKGCIEGIPEDEVCFEVAHVEVAATALPTLSEGVPEAADGNTTPGHNLEFVGHTFV